MSRLEEALKRSGTGGLFGTQSEPPAEAPAPLDSAEHDLHKQWQLLVDYLDRVRGDRTR